MEDGLQLNTSSRERTGYLTQKPLALLESIITASSEVGDMVLDPFAGCATTCVAAAKRARQWVSIDISLKAAELVAHRLGADLGMLHEGVPRTDVTQRTDLAAPLSPREHKHYRYGIQEGDCGGCEEHFPIRNLTIDHVVPQSKGGSDHLENLQLLCGACNSTKGSGTHEQFLARLAERGIRPAGKRSTP